MSDLTRKVERSLARFDRVMTVIDEKEGPVASQARRERRQSLQRYSRAARNSALAVLAVSIVTIVIGLVTPIGMFGFLAAVLLALGIAGMLFFTEAREASARPTVSPDLPNGQMVQRFDSYLFRARRALPAPAQAELDRIAAQLPPLRQVLERLPDLDPAAQDARRLMSVHLPNLIDRYLNVPPAYRTDFDAEGLSVDDRLVESLSAGRQALTEIAQDLARQDKMAFETQGRFIKSRYGEDGPKALEHDS
jgi:hypothetical protein